MNGNSQKFGTLASAISVIVTILLFLIDDKLDQLFKILAGIAIVSAAVIYLVWTHKDGSESYMINRSVYMTIGFVFAVGAVFAIIAFKVPIHKVVEVPPMNTTTGFNPTPTATQPSGPKNTPNVTSETYGPDPTPDATTFDIAYTYYDNGQYDLSFPLFMQAAKEGDSNGELYVGCSYRDGKGVKQDSSAAFSWFSIAANHGNAQAQYNLGYCYYRGDGVRANSSLAFEWFQKSAEQGNKFGLLWTGFCYHKGIGVTKSLDDAELYYEAAIKAGNQDAADRLAELIQERGY